MFGSLDARPELSIVCSDLIPILPPLAMFKKPLADIKTTGIRSANMTTQSDLSDSWYSTSSNLGQAEAQAARARHL